MVDAATISRSDPGSMAIRRLPSASTEVPSTSVVRAPRRRDTRADTGEKITIAAPIGSRTTPAATSDRPKP
jgi:hypothetical protein